jgi:choice-of-anchor B domain-containing protein
MKAFSWTLAALAALGNQAAARELIPNEETRALYDSGTVHMELKSLKLAGWDKMVESGQMDSSQYKSRSAADPAVKCVNGVAAVGSDRFKCSNIDFFDFKNHKDLGSSTGEGSSSWGWTSDTGREFVVIAQADGAAFAEITSAGKLVYLGRLPKYTSTSNSIWREIRGFKNYIVFGSEASRHGVQIFDWRKLLTIDPAKPVTFSNTADLTGYFNGLPSGSTHNIVVNEEKNYAVAVGAVPRTGSCQSGLIFIDLSNPAKPTSPGCASGDGYVHDAQCIVYRGPDTRYNGKEVCYGFNEDTLTIYDVTDKKTTNIISRTSYTGASYTHQGWVTNTTWQEFLVVDDEYDEYRAVGPGASGYAITYFWDIRDLRSPKQTGYFKSPGYGPDHNQFVVDGFTYQSNYGSGLRVLDVRSLKQDPTGKLVKEVGFFDVYPENDNQPNGGSLEFVGTWSSYPFFKSGYILVNTIERGAFVVKRSN